MALSIKNLSITVGTKELLLDESVGIADGSKVGLIGRNGVGKTTLLKAILGQAEYSGHIKFNGKAAYFSQGIDLDLTKTGWQTIGERAVVHHQNQFEKEILEIETLLSSPAVHQDHIQLSRLTDRYVELQGKIEKQKNTQPTNRIKSVLRTLEVKESWLDQSIASLSTGQRAIISLAQILSSDADLLLLDEPTNHLDFKRLNILENYLREFKGSVLMVTHDRYFLNTVCDTILKIENGKWIKYNGNYSAYVKTREAAFAAQKNAFEVEQDYIANEKDKIARIGKSPLKVKQGKYREKLLARREVIDEPDLDKSDFETPFEASPINAKVVLDLEDLSVGYSKPLISNINFGICVGERIVLVGENGMGKSTLFKTIEGRIPALSGKVKLNSEGKLGYVDQELKDLKTESTLYEEIYSILQNMGRTRANLSMVGFVTNEEVNKRISQLSMGEKSRLNLLKVLLTKPNLLLLDEPTNHLDIDACEIIEKAFLNYEGAILAVSHDKYFIEKIAQRVLQLKDGTIKEIKTTD
ncbi:MAG: ABC-F family ATP-binding cassette domain-containing protein [archaeon]